jgi:uncharacterized membrane protein
MENLVRVLLACRVAIGVMGTTIILVGVARAFWSFCSLEIRLRGRELLEKRDQARIRLGSYLLLGLEFLIAADIINTMIKPTLQDLALLGSIVVIRTVLSYFLTREMRQQGVK